MGATTGLAYPRPWQVAGRLVRGAPRLGMPGTMVAVTGQSASPAAPQSPPVLQAVLERITYASEDTGYTITRVVTDRTGPDLLHARTGQDLAPAQQEAAQLALTQKVAVLTGGPGCGKSFTVRSIVQLATAKNATVMLAAPTGRAAKRLAELTGHQACTVHWLLELQPGGDPKYDRDNPWTPIWS
jgi:hypothetical protein